MGWIVSRDLASGEVSVMGDLTPEARASEFGNAVDQSVESRDANIAASKSFDRQVAALEESRLKEE